MSRSLPSSRKLHGKPGAFFKTLDSRNNDVILQKIHDAKRTAMRAKHTAKLVTMLSEQRKLYS